MKNFGKVAGLILTVLTMAFVSARTNPGKPANAAAPAPPNHALAEMPTPVKSSPKPQLSNSAPAETPTAVKSSSLLGLGPTVTCNQTCSPSQACPGAAVTYTINLAVSGSVALGAVVTDVLPAGLSYVQGTATTIPGGVFTCVGPTLTWVYTTLGPCNCTMTYVAQVGNTLGILGQLLQNTCIITSTSLSAAVSATTGLVVCAAVNTPTPVPTIAVPTPTFTPVPATPTFTLPPTNTFTPAPPTPTFTPVPPTSTFTLTPTHTYTQVPPTPTFTLTPTNTLTSTHSFTATCTNSPTNSFTATATPTNSFTHTNTLTATCTNSPTNSFTATFTPTLTFTRTSTLTATSSPTNSFTNTHTFTSTATNTPTNSFTATATPTNSFTATATPTRTFTMTATNTPTNSFTATSTPTNSFTATATPTNSFTMTATNTPTNSFTATSTPTNSFTATFTPTNTVTATATNTPTNTFTATATPTNSSTSTATNTPTNTFTATSTATNTFTYTNSFTATCTNSPTNSFTSTNSFTTTCTNTPTNTFTPVPPTATPTFTSTPTPVVSLSKTASEIVALTGDVVTYTLHLNVSGSAASNVQVTDVLPIGCDFVQGSESDSLGAAFSVSGSTLTWIMSQAGPCSCSMIYQVKVNGLAAVGAVMANTATLISSSLGSPLSCLCNVTMGTPPMPTSTPIPIPTITLGQVCSPASAALGAAVTYTLNLGVTGCSCSAHNVAIQDVLPAGLTYVQGTATTLAGGTFSASGQTLSWVYNSVGPCSCTMTYVAQVDNSLIGLIGETLANTAVLSCPSLSSSLSALANLKVTGLLGL